MKAKKKTKKVNVISIEILNYVLDGIYKRLDSINDQLVALRNKDTELIDLDNAVTDGTNGIGVDDSEEVLDKTDLKNIIESLKYYRNYNPMCNAWDTDKLVFKLNKMLKEKE